MAARHIALFDLYAGGHHAQYIQYVLDYWVAHVRGHRMDVAVPQSFLDTHPEVAAFCEAHASAGIRAVPLGEPDFGDGGLLRADAEHGRLMAAYTTTHRPDHVVCMYFDHVQLSLAKRLRLPAGTTVSGIYFRPSFHYGTFGPERLGMRERIQRLRKRWVLRAALQHPAMAHLFTLDPYVLPQVVAMQAHGAAHALPDGVALEEQRLDDAHRRALRMQHSIPDDRFVALVVGVLSERKGVFRTLEALSELPDAVQKQLCIWLAGKPHTGAEEAVRRAVQHARDTTHVHIVVDARFLAEDEFQPFLQAADLSLVLYQRHIGSSNILIRSALAGRPVLASDYGLVGAVVRAHRLGVAIDATSSGAIAHALAQAVGHPASVPFDARSAKAYAHANSATAFAHTLLSPFGVVPQPQVAP